MVPGYLIQWAKSQMAAGMLMLRWCSVEVIAAARAKLYAKHQNDKGLRQI
jgi:hypothetical protein